VWSAQIFQLTISPLNKKWFSDSRPREGSHAKCMNRSEGKQTNADQAPRRYSPVNDRQRLNSARAYMTRVQYIRIYPVGRLWGEVVHVSAEIPVETYTLTKLE
jgi:hypothetical protein